MIDSARQSLFLRTRTECVASVLSSWRSCCCCCRVQFVCSLLSVSCFVLASCDSLEPQLALARVALWRARASLSGFERAKRDKASSLGPEWSFCAKSSLARNWRHTFAAAAAAERARSSSEMKFNQRCRPLAGGARGQVASRREQANLLELSASFANCAEEARAQFAQAHVSRARALTLAQTFDWLSRR